MKKSKLHLKFLEVRLIFTIVALMILNIPLNAGIVEKTFYFEKPRIYENQNYDYLEMDDCFYLENPTKPQLPAKQVRLLLPPGEQAVKIWVNGQNIIPIEGQFFVYPAQYEQIVSDHYRIFTEPDMQFYASNDIYPQELHSSFETQYFRGYSIVIFDIYPVQYLPGARKLSYYSEIAVKVETSSTSESADSYNGFFRGDEKTRQKVQEIAQNYDVVSKYPQNTSPKSNYDIDFLIITSDAFEDDFDEFVKFKKLQGYNTFVETVEDIYALYNGYDNQDEIRMCIKDFYQNHGTDYVLLGGDVEIVPHRNLFGEVILNTSNGPNHILDEIPADLYYAGLDRYGVGVGPDWNVDNDNKWGEVNVSSPIYGDINEADFIAEVYIGRISADSHTEFANALNKQIMYQKDPVVSDNKRDIMVGERMWVGYCGDEAMEEIRVGGTYDGYTTAGFTDGGFTSQLQYACQYLPDSAWPLSHLVAKMNGGASIINHLGHGNRGFCMKFSDWDNSVNQLTSDGINHNFHMLYSQTCYGSSFDNRNSDSTYGIDCITELFTTHSKGIFAVVGNSRYGLSQSSQKFHRYYFDAMFKTSNPIKKLGEMQNYSKEQTGHNSAGNRWEYYELNLFGDPSLEFWTTNSPLYITSAAITSNVYIGMTQLTVQVSPAIAGLRVSVCTDNYDAIFGTAFTNSSGIAIIELNHALNQEATIYGMVTGENYLPYEFIGGAYVPGIWTGAISTNWHNTGNWESGLVPNSTSNVNIPDGCINYPVINSPVAECNDLQIAENASVTIGNTQLHVLGDLIVQGELAMTTSSSNLQVFHTISWEAGSTANITNGSAMIVAYYDWVFKAGSNVHLDNGFVNFSGNISKGIKCNSPDSYFNHVMIAKDENKYMFYSGSSMEDMVIKGNLFISTGAILRHYSDYKMIVNGLFDCDGRHLFSSGTFVFNGGAVSVFSNPESYFNNVEINASGNITCMTDIEIRGNLTINSGTLKPQAHTISIEGDWTNNAGESGFDTSLGTVLFTGDAYQEILTDANFNVLEIDKTGGNLRVNDIDVEVICNQYNWTQGWLAMGSGEFTALDLLDNGIFGNYSMSSGTINLMNYDGFVDLNCDIVISGGYFNVYGGIDDSFWSYGAAAAINMSGGVLDFHDVGINIYDSPSYSFSENISGGTIKTCGDFGCERSGFTPTNCEIRLYGPDNAILSSISGSYYDDVRIEKGVVENVNPIIKTGDTKSSYPKARKKKGVSDVLSVGEDSKSNLVTLGSEIIINGDLRVNYGELDLNGNKFHINGNLFVGANLTMNNAADELWVGGMIEWNPGAVGNITDGSIKFNGTWTFYNGSDVQIAPGNSANAIGTINQNINCYDENACFGNLNLNQQLTGVFVSSSGSQPIRVAGDLTVISDNTLKLNNDEMIASGQVFTYSSSSLVVENGGSFTAENDFDLFGSAHLIDGNITVGNDFYCNTSGSLIIDGGSFIMDRNSVDQFQVVNGYFEMNGGLFEATYNGIIFGQSTTLTMTGGEIATGWDFSAWETNTFQPSGGALRMIGTSTGSINLNETNFLYDLIIDKPVSSEVDFTQTVLVNNDLTIESGELNTNGFDLTVNGSVVIEQDGVLNPANNSVFVGRDWTNNHGDSGYLEGNNITTFIGNGSSYIHSDETFHILNVDKNTSPYTYLWSDSNRTVNVYNLNINSCSYRLGFNSTINVSNNLVIGENTNLFAPNSENSYINIQGQWYNYNTTGYPWTYGFWYGMSTVTFNGVDDQFLHIANGTQEFYNLNIDKPSNWFMPLADLDIYGDVNIIQGTWEEDVAGLDFTFMGDVFIQSAGAFNDNTCNVVIIGSENQNFFNYSSNPTNISNLQLNMTPQPGVPVFTIIGDIICSGSITIDTGDFYINSQTVECLGNFAINENGIVTAPDLSIIAMGSGSAFDINGGELRMFGNETNNPKITHVSGNYEFSVYNDGMLSTSYAIFEYMDNNGINIYSTGEVYSTNAFSNCTFRNGNTGGTLLQINNDQDLVIDGVNFPDNIWGGAYNVAKTANQGSINFTNFIGDFAGYLFEDDPYNRISWGNPVPGIWTGAVSPIWNLAANWENNLKPTASDDVYIPAGTPNDPWVSQADQECNNVFIEAGASLRIFDEILTVHGNMIIFGELKMDHVSGVLNAGDSYGDEIIWEAGSTDNISLGTINVFGNWNFKDGTNAQLGIGNTVNFYGTNRSFIYCDDTDATFGNVLINKTSSTKDFVYIPANNIFRVAEDLYVQDGILDVSDNVYLHVGNEFYVDDGAKLNTIGSVDAIVIISGYPEFCNLEIASGGTIAAEYTKFEYLESQGLTVNSGAVIDPIHPFHHCTFEEGPVDGTLLTIANDQVLTIDGAVFPINMWEGAYNVSKPNNAGHLTFTNVDGGFCSEANENDIYNRIDWPGVAPGIWTGLSGSMWYANNNWKYQLVPFDNDDVIISAGAPHYPVVTNIPQQCKNILIEAGASLEIGETSLTVYDDIIIHGELIMNHPSGELYTGDFPGDIISFEPGSSANVTYGTINVYGNWYFKNGTNAEFGWGNTVIFYGSNFSTIYCDDDDAGFGNLTINKSAPPKDVVTLPANNFLRVAEDFYIADGSLKLNEGSVFEVGNELYVDNGGTLSSLGTAGNNAIVSGTSNYCLLEIANGGTISAEYTVFELLEYYGVTVNPGAVIDPLHPFNYCTFQEGTAGGSLLTVNNDQVLTIDGANFPANTWGGASNVSKTLNQGKITFTNVEGTFVGEGFEDDPNNRIFWPGIVAGIWTGEVSTSWNDPANWDYYLKPDENDDVYIPAGTPYDPWVSQGDQACNNIIIEAGALLKIEDEILSVYGNMIIYGQLTMDHPDGVLNIGSNFGNLISWENGSSDDITNGTINVFGDWYFKFGTLSLLGPGNTVNFYGNNRSTIYCFEPNAGFGNLTINKSAYPKDIVNISSFNTLNIAGDLYIGDGVLKVNEGSKLYVGNELYVDSEGTILILGMPNYEAEAVISGFPNYCLFEVANGGTIGAEYAIFEFIEYNGVTINQGATIDLEHPFTHCVFKESPTGGTLLTIENDQDIIIEGAHFPDNTWSGNFNVSKNSTSGDINFMNATGGFSGEDYDNDPNDLIHWGLRNIDLDLKVYLEGPYVSASGGLMATDLNLGGYIPLNQPYNPSLPYYDIANPNDLKWLYNGTESVGAIPMNAVDWVLVQLRDATSPANATSSTIIGTQAAFVLNDGSIVALDGVSPVNFYLAYSNNLYAVIYHRNHLAIISNYPLVESEGLYSYNFSTSELQALGGANGHKQLESGVWGMVSSDGNGNGLIQNTDETAVWKVDLGSSGYKGGDFNMNGLTQNTDETNYWKVNLGSGGQTPGKNTGYESQVPD